MGIYGIALYVQHTDGMTIYMHINEYPSGYVYLGKTVQKGNTIGRLGIRGNSTGYQLYFGCKQGSSFTYNSANAYRPAKPADYIV